MDNGQNLINVSRHIREAIVHLSVDLEVLGINPQAEALFNCQQAGVISLDFISLCSNAGWSAISAHYMKQLKAKQIPLQSIEILRGNEKISWTIIYALQGAEIIGFIFIGQYSKGKTSTLASTVDSASNFRIIDQFLQRSHQSITAGQVEAATLEYGRSVYQYMENIIAAMPGSVYWINRQAIYLGCNDNMAKLLNLKTREDIIGKTYADLYEEKSASFYKKSDSQVMSLDESLLIEEPLYFGEKEKRVYLSNKVPLHDKSGAVIGMLGISIDITAQKEMERLQVENEVNKNSAKEQEKFVKVANQVAHDIRSPLASLLMIVKSCKEIPESDRIALREAAVGISDIANNLLSRYRKKEPDGEDQERQAILVSTVLMQILTEKKYQYQNLQVKFDCHFGSNSYFSFIKISPSAVKRMLSNLINNAVDAFEKKPGKIDLNVEVDSEWVKISIQDNGKGMPKEIVDKILQNTAVTAGKEAGHGIGLTQVREALENNQGEMTIDSQLGVGTKITLIFPRIKTPNWIAEEIAVGKEDVIVVLYPKRMEFRR